MASTRLWLPGILTAAVVALVAVLTLAAGAAGAAGAAAPAAPARTFHTVLEDDGEALFPQSQAQLTHFMHTLTWLGVDELRISAEWKIEAPNPDGAAPPRGFRAADPRSYDGSVGMQLLDRADRAAAAAGIGVIVDPAFSAPRWATRDPPRRDATGGTLYNDNIDVSELATWEGMLAERYSGHDTPRGEQTPLPRVGTFTLWNEPNQSGFFAPQYRDGQPFSPAWERALIRAADPAIKRASPDATVLIGNTSSTGANPQAGNAGVPPLTFIRQLACVNAQLQPIDTGSCANFTMLPADGYSQHTYEYTQPPWIATGHDDAEVGDLAGLQALLDRLVAMHRLAPGAAHLWVTEQGYESNGQLTGEPWTETQQAQLNADTEYLTWRDGQADSFAQFLLRDTLTDATLDLRRRTGNPHALIGGTWTTGLERQDGTAKPALAMFRTPVVARTELSSTAANWLFASPVTGPARIIEVWGRARPIRSRTLVIVQATDEQGSWQTVSETTTDANGIFDVNVPVTAEVPVGVRFRWLDRSGHWETSPLTEPVTMRP